YLLLVYYQVSSYRSNGEGRTGRIAVVSVGPGSKNTYEVKSEGKSFFFFSYRKFAVGDQVQLISSGKNVVVGSKSDSIWKLLLENFDDGRYISVYAAFAALALCITAVVLGNGAGTAEGSTGQ